MKSYLLAKPLLNDESDFVKVADAIIKMTEVYNKYDDTAVCFMGHGTGAAANDVYEKLQHILRLKEDTKTIM